MRSFAKLRFSEGFLCGLAVSSSVLLVMVGVLDDRFTDHVLNNISEYLIVLTLILAAYLALRGISLQIAHSQEVDDKRNSSLLTASRASLVLTLSELTTICRTACVFTLNTPRTQAGAVTDAKKFALPDRSLQIIKECITYADAETGSRLANIIRHFQVVTARTVSSYEDPDVITSNFSNTLDWVIVSLLISACFDFAREHSSGIPSSIGPGRIFSALWMSFDIKVHQYDGLQEAIDIREKRDNLELVSKRIVLN